MENKNSETDRLLRRALSSPEKPDDRLILKVKDEILKEESGVKKSTFVRRSFSSVAVAALVVALISTTAFAAWNFLKPSEVADRFGDKTLSAAFESETAVNINASATSGDYTFTFLAVATGEDITDMPYYSDDVDVQSDRTYAVIAVQKADGTPMPNPQDDDYGQTPFFATPLVKGLKPWQVNAFTMNGGYSETVADGIMYRLVECDGIAIFADRGLYFAINTGSFYDTDAFIYNEQTGEITANENYSGSSAVFSLPLDEKLADPEKAEQYLNDLNSSFADDAADIAGDYSTGVNLPGSETDFILSLTPYESSVSNAD